MVDSGHGPDAPSRPAITTTLPSLDPSVLATRAADHAHSTMPSTAEVDLASFDSAVNQALVAAAAVGDPWLVPRGARLRGIRTALARLLRAQTDRQGELDANMASSVALLAEYCRALAARVAAVEAELSDLRREKEAQ